MRILNESLSHSKIIALTKIVALTLCCFSGSVFAQDLLSFYCEAEVSDSTLQAAKEIQLVQREAIPQARAQFLPFIGGQITYTSNDTTDPTLGSFNSEIYNLTLTQPILHFEHWKKYEQASDRVKQANANFSAAEQDLMIRAAQAYFGVLQAIDNLYFAKASVKAFSNFVAQTQERFKVGLITITDVEIARAQHDNSVAQQIAAENDLYNQKERLRNLVGHSVEYLSPLRDELNLLPPAPIDMEKWVTTALAQNFQLQAARYGTEASKANININRYGHLPTIDIIGQVQRSAPIPTLPGPRIIDSNAGVQINIPIFQGGAISSKTREAIHNYLKTDREMETLYRNVEISTRQAFHGVLTQIQQTAALKNAVNSNKSALEATHASFNVGTRTIVDVLNAQTNLIQAQKSYAGARYAYIIQSLQLKQAAGILCADDLRHINAWLKCEDVKL